MSTKMRKNLTPHDIGCDTFGPGPWTNDPHKIDPPAHCTKIDFALSFGAVIVKIIDLSKSNSGDFFGIILDQKNSQKLHLLPKTC